ncbi:hypothetical protein CVT24_009615 [Panaeolus cyanescens]|uniref:Uncharacterized protein n=1 Tax=Panaeolus cyanescens TaxID=181874 RepID=A0A409YA31_9AGAR|nr:hypothetical protein CVT24_009615 [Panaeolus cyanescens]
MTVGFHGCELSKSALINRLIIPCASEQGKTAGNQCQGRAITTRGRYGAQIADFSAEIFMNAPNEYDDAELNDVPSTAIRPASKGKRRPDRGSYVGEGVGNLSSLPATETNFDRESGDEGGITDGGQGEGKVEAEEEDYGWLTGGENTEGEEDDED